MQNTAYGSPNRQVSHLMLFDFARQGPYRLGFLTPNNSPSSQRGSHCHLLLPASLRLLTGSGRFCSSSLLPWEAFRLTYSIRRFDLILDLKNWKAMRQLGWLRLYKIVARKGTEILWLIVLAIRQLFLPRFRLIPQRESSLAGPPKKRRRR